MPVNNPVMATAAGECYLSLSGGGLLLSRHRGARLTINGIAQVIPAGGVTLAPTGLNPSNLYFIYAYMSGGTMKLEASTTGHATSATSGVEIKTGDETRTLVGMAYAVAGPAFVDSGASRLVISWFNRKNKSTNMTLGGGSTASPSFVEINASDRISFLTWSDEAIDFKGEFSTLSNQSSSWWSVAIGLDGEANVKGFSQFSGGTNVVTFGFAPAFAATITEGFHFVTPLARISNGSTVTLQSGGTSELSGTVIG